MPPAAISAEFHRHGNILPYRGVIIPPASAYQSADRTVLPRRARVGGSVMAYPMSQSDVNRCALNPAAANSSKSSLAWTPMNLSPTLMALSARGATR